MTDREALQAIMARLEPVAGYSEGLAADIRAIASAALAAQPQAEPSSATVPSDGDYARWAMREGAVQMRSGEYAFAFPTVASWSRFCDHARAVLALAAPPSATVPTDAQIMDIAAGYRWFDGDEDRYDIPAICREVLALAAPAVQAADYDTPAEGRYIDVDKAIDAVAFHGGSVEIEAHLRSLAAPAVPKYERLIEAAKTEHGNAEDLHVAQSEHLNCPTCGGSGHVDDAPAVQAEPMADEAAHTELGSRAYRAAFDAGRRDAINEMRENEPAAQSADAVDAAQLIDAMSDMLNGWKYIRRSHGDLYGVGWDRAQDKMEAALAALSQSAAAAKEAKE